MASFSQRGPNRPHLFRERSAVVAILVALTGQLLAVPVVAALTPQTITFSLPASGLVGAPLSLSPTADSGLAVTVASSTPAVCTIDVATLNLDAVGTCSVTASQAGDAAFDPAADVVASLTVEPVPPVTGPQAITFTMPASGFVGTTLPLAPTADSGLNVSVVTSTPAVCTIDIATLTLDAVGTCTVTASQAGNSAFDPAADVVASMSVEPVPPVAGPQTITFTLPASGILGATLTLAPTASSGLAVTLSSSTPAVCLVDAVTLTLVMVGTCTVTASQAGDAAFEPAADVVASMAVESPSPQTILFSLPASGLLGASLSLTPTADSGLTVAVTSSTPAVCTISGTTLNLDALGTCSVTASQAGDAAFEPAADVVASMTVESVPQGVDLGRYAVNGTVKALAVDATTGRTYLGGDFTQIGLRTGPVAVVNPPDVGSGTLQAASPEVLGAVKAVFADDRPGDPGFFIAGELIAVNGEPVPNTPVVRMHLDVGGTKWIVDPAWSVSADCAPPGQSVVWVATPGLLVFGQFAIAANPTGLATIDRLTGACSSPALRTLATIPSLSSCAALPYCSANVTQLTWDDATHSLIVAYSSVSGATANTLVREGTLASYDLGGPSGTRRWVTALQSAPPAEVADWYGSSTGIAVAGGAILVRGYFRLEPTDVDHDTASRLISVDPTTGTILQRWNVYGEQSLSDGTTIGPASECLTRQSSLDPFFLVDTTAAQWVVKDGYPIMLWMLCEYRTTDGSVVGSQFGAWTVTVGAGKHLPSISYRSGSTGYLLGPDSAVETATGDPVDWHPDPGMPFGSYAPTIALSAGGIIVGGDFTFLRGRTTPGVVALKANLDPDPGFDPPILSQPTPDVRALALDQGWLLVGGAFSGPTSAQSDVRSIVALDPSTGQMKAWDPSAATPYVVQAIAVNQSTGDFWVGGPSQGNWGAPSAALLHFAPPADGGAPLVAPALDCLEAPALPDYAPDALCPPAGSGRSNVSALAFDAGGRLYLGGTFGAIDGHARRGLARLDASGAVDDWSGDLLGVLPIPAGSGLWIFEPYALATHRNQLLVGGRFCYIAPNPTGGGSGTCISPLLVFSTLTGALLRPTNPAVSPWFPVFGWWSSGYAIVAKDSGVAVALGDVGVAILDPTTLDFDADASAGLINNGWWAHDYRVGVFALAVPITPLPNVPQTHRAFVPTIPSAQPTTQIVLGGSIPRWGYHVAGNVARTVVGVTYTLTIGKTGSGSGTVTSRPGTIVCGANCAGEVVAGASVTLTATPASGSTFAGWSGAGCSGTLPCTFTMATARTVTATFVALPVPVVTIPGASLRAGVALAGSSIPIALAWTATDIGGPGIARYELQRSTNGGVSWTVVSSTVTARSFNTTTPSSGTVRFRVRATDLASLVGAWATGPTLTPRLLQQNSTLVKYHGTWRNTSSASYCGGSAKYATSAGAYATYTFTGRSIALITTKARLRGKVKIYVNGVYQATVDMYSSSTKYRMLAWQKTWTTYATRTVKLVVVGGGSRPRFDLDAFATLK